MWDSTKKYSRIIFFSLKGICLVHIYNCLFFANITRDIGNMIKNIQ